MLVLIQNPMGLNVYVPSVHVLARIAGGMSPF